MTGKFVVPAATFLGGLLTWVAILVLFARADGLQVRLPWLAPAVCTVAGALVVISAASCRRAGGPRAGGFIRAGVLLVATAVTAWRLELAPAVPLVLAAIATAAVALTGSWNPAATLGPAAPPGEPRP